MFDMPGVGRFNHPLAKDSPKGVKIWLLASQPT